MSFHTTNNCLFNMWNVSPDIDEWINWLNDGQMKTPAFQIFLLMWNNSTKILIMSPLEIYKRYHKQSQYYSRFQTSYWIKSTVLWLPSPILVIKLWLYSCMKHLIFTVHLRHYIQFYLISIALFTVCIVGKLFTENINRKHEHLKEYCEIFFYGTEWNC